MKKILSVLLAFIIMISTSGCSAIKKIDYTTYYDGFLEKYDYSSVTSVTYVGEEAQMTIAYDGERYLNSMTINHTADSSNENDSSYKASLIVLENSDSDLYIYTENGENYYYEIATEGISEEPTLFESFIDDTTTVKYSGEVSDEESGEIFDVLVATKKVAAEEDSDSSGWGTVYEVSFSYQGKEYEAYYVVYSDGTYILSDDFPTEMDPYYTAETPWIVVGTSGIQNEDTGEVIEFTLTNTYSEMYLYGYELYYTVYILRSTGRIYEIVESYSAGDQEYCTYLDLLTTVPSYEIDDSCTQLTSDEIYSVIVSMYYTVYSDLGFY